MKNHIVSLRVDDATWHALKTQAKVEDRTISNYIRMILKRFVKNKLV